MSCFKRFTVISGSPGTGKTTTVAKILALLIDLDDSKKLRIALTAPTGKAAARLQESISRTKETLNCTNLVKAKIPDKATTIHRLLGSLFMSPYFRHNAGNPLPYDLIVIDEVNDQLEFVRNQDASTDYINLPQDHYADNNRQ